MCHVQEHHDLLREHPLVLKIVSSAAQFPLRVSWSVRWDFIESIVKLPKRTRRSETSALFTARLPRHVIIQINLVICHINSYPISIINWSRQNWSVMKRVRRKDFDYSDDLFLSPVLLIPSKTFQTFRLLNIRVATAKSSSLSDCRWLIILDPYSHNLYQCPERVFLKYFSPFQRKHNARDTSLRNSLPILLHIRLRHVLPAHLILILRLSIVVLRRIEYLRTDRLPDHLTLVLSQWLHTNRT